jgi:hypothetical protein
VGYIYFKWGTFAQNIPQYTPHVNGFYWIVLDEEKEKPPDLSSGF